MSRTTQRDSAGSDELSVQHDDHGEKAQSPQQIPAKGWLQVSKRAWGEASDDQVPLLAAGVAFKAFLAIFPALTAAFLLWSLFGNPDQITNQIDQISAIPQEARDLVTSQVEHVSENKASAGWSAALAIVLALWSASSGVQNLMAATNMAYDEDETRGFVKRKGVALLLTLGAIVFMLLAIGFIAVAPVLVNALGASGVVNVVVSVLRWVLLLGLVLVALAVVYRLAPDRDSPRMKWTSVGAGVATALWLLVSIGFSLYVTLAGGSSYVKNYGALAGVVILLMWLWLTSYAILLGAEINAESERQTDHDTTVGDPQPMGERDAVAADRKPEDR
ncbi:YihY/virulence factor BrkB family protein [Paenibacillus sp. TRM 82003]|uniref:YihY/virulence factor BrkB family protein n=1 Tax=Kineococcus sp. TRM81007 TaxID=2925831 RepID=UPI001F5816FB|nr:YihY/virulence factor BrkB family protein [Kineococcus sp. TRM81007]MCI2240355.1 YihY/virulence factor BrkB family protein [Kineococcus sp. TRM81007]MCI3927468.1 YihY/virulence factor BrkB family protein [Paenibacillus sp. TRM 82003]